MSIKLHYINHRSFKKKKNQKINKIYNITLRSINEIIDNR